MPARVVHESEVAPTPARRGSGAEVRVLIDEAAGSRELLQRTLRVGPGGEVGCGHPEADDVVYVAMGSGWMRAGPRRDRRRLEPGTALLVPPKVAATAANDGVKELVLVSVLSPLPFAGASHAEGRGLPLGVTREADQEPEPAGDDRSFRVLIDPRFGCRNVTQFVGSIERSRAPFHTHTYEEAIYVLGGEGVLHADGMDAPIRRGSSVFLPPGTPHCLENAGAETLRLLGAFSPPGSPAGRIERPAGPG